MSQPVAGFVNGCYWRRCAVCGMDKRPLPQGPNAERWKKKFERNVERRLEYIAQLESSGYCVVECWECEMKTADGLAQCVNRFTTAVLARLTVPAGQDGPHGGQEDVKKDQK